MREKCPWACSVTSAVAPGERTPGWTQVDPNWPASNLARHQRAWDPLACCHIPTHGTTRNNAAADRGSDRTRCNCESGLLAGASDYHRIARRTKPDGYARFVA